MRRSSSLSLTVIAFVSLLLSGCSGFDDARIRQHMQAGQLKIGASKQAIATLMGTRPSFCMKRKATADATLEMWDYVSSGCAANLTESYILIFKDNTLAEIRTVQSRLDMQF